MLVVGSLLYVLISGKQLIEFSIANPTQLEKIRSLSLPGIGICMQISEDSEWVFVLFSDSTICYFKRDHFRTNKHQRITCVSGKYLSAAFTINHTGQNVYFKLLNGNALACKRLGTHRYTFYRTEIVPTNVCSLHHRSPRLLLSKTEYSIQVANTWSRKRISSNFSTTGTLTVAVPFKRAFEFLLSGWSKKIHPVLAHKTLKILQTVNISEGPYTLNFSACRNCYAIGGDNQSFELFKIQL